MVAYPRPLGGDQNRVSTILAIYWTPYPILVILIGARVFVRVKIQYLGLDDYFMLLAWVRKFTSFPQYTNNFQGHIECE